MQYTFGQACRILGASSHAYGASDIRASINAAVQSLASLSGWERLRRVVRFSSVGPVFTLPQGCAGLVRVCVNGRPTTIRGQDFRFIQSGPGDIRRPPAGFRLIPVSNIYDLGSFPTMLVPTGSFQLLAFSDEAHQPPLSVKAVDPTGRVVDVSLPMHTMPTYDGATIVSGEDPAAAVADSPIMSSIISVALDECASAYVTLFAVDPETDGRAAIALYNPEVKAPSFRRYEIPGIAPGQPVDILAETRIDPVPLVAESDVVPFQCLDPIEWMIRASWQMKAGETESAQRYHDKAAQWLKAQEIADDTYQTQVIVNSVVSGSPGEISMESFNI